ncbi:hypothetical protein [Geopsychrobacter electrodiphilus]|uniref:hypothetical protein n=1 Tax=Geopsychrobacter electrodiphilus TaxID=225196 RepID=UPI0003A7CAD9|nr:hypothetical protein [Geopsychrobacter electrodiphilus]
MTSETLTDLLPRSAGDEIVTPLNFKHPAGQAIRVESQTPSGKLISLAIAGPHRSYLLSVIISAADYDQLQSTIEKVLLSFSILTADNL